jgi:hypothetical protein
MLGKWRSGGKSSPVPVFNCLGVKLLQARVFSVWAGVEFPGDVVDLLL